MNLSDLMQGLRDAAQLQTKIVGITLTQAEVAPILAEYDALKSRGRGMTPEELNALPIDIKVKLAKFENLVREIMLDLGPARVSELLDTMAAALRSVQIRPEK